MKAGLIGLAVVIVLVLGLGGCVAGSYNQLVRGKADYTRQSPTPEYAYNANLATLIDYELRPVTEVSYPCTGPKLKGL